MDMPAFMESAAPELPPRSAAPRRSCGEKGNASGDSGLGRFEAAMAAAVGRGSREGAGSCEWRRWVAAAEGRERKEGGQNVEQSVC
uniref:Uncharacterized protein n=1 Tax=Arundo donax TaxID=35708 RepID=A0A0A8ZRG7_ARUDO